jgi:hypothetical protein
MFRVITISFYNVALTLTLGKFFDDLIEFLKSLRQV